MNRNTKRPIVAISVNDRRVYKFESITQACQILKVRHSEIYRVLMHERKTTGGYTFEDLDEYVNRRHK